MEGQGGVVIRISDLGLSHISPEERRFSTKNERLSEIMTAMVPQILDIF